LSRFWGIPLFRRLSTKMVAGFIAIVAIFSTLGVVVLHEVNTMRAASDEALARAGAVHHIEEARIAAAQQIQAHYELMLENKEDKITSFETARQVRDAALADASAHGLSDIEQEWFKQLTVATAGFDNNFMNELVPAWRSGDTAATLAREKQSDEFLLTINNLSQKIAVSFSERNREAQAASDNAASELRTYFILAGIIGVGLSLLISVIAARRLSRPINELKKASAAMARGDYDRRVEVATFDEIAELGGSFNRMADAIQRKVAQLTFLSDIALTISSELDWERVVDVVMEKGIELTDSQAAAITLYDEERGEFTDIFTKGLSDDFVGKMQFRKGGLAEESLLGEQAVFSDNVMSSHRLSRMASDEGIKAFICLPLKVQKKKLGVLYVYSKEFSAYSRDHLSVLSILSNQAAIAIQNAQVLQQSKEEAVTDGLTGLYNQRYFYSRLKDEIDRAQRNNKSISVIFCDLDRFKTFNDINGHALGDTALVEISRIIGESKRAIDIAARYGGEEFAIILPDTDTSGAQIIAHRIRRRVAGFSFETNARNGAPLTISIGVASFPEDAPQARDLVDKADWSMYYGKRHGGNRVTLFHEESAEFGEVTLEDLVREELHIAAAQAMAASVDERSTYDQRHAESVARLASTIATEMRLEDDQVHHVRVAGLLHDIGLISVPEDIINKRGHLSPEEWRRIKEHPEVGESILKHITSLESFLPVVRHHHEHYDGAGYPDGLSDEKIPLGARILAVADAFQAMTSERPYRKALTIEQALLELQMGAGKQFDPRVIDAFISLLKPRQAKAS